MRDEFNGEVKRTLSNRVNNACSNPDCQSPTSGPQLDSSKAANIGVAAHITAASLGGPRYNPLLNPEQRSHADNGIWLCQNCAKLVDNDPSLYPETVLRAWKLLAEHRAFNSMGKTVTPVHVNESESQKLRGKLLQLKDKLVTLTQMNTGSAVMMLGPKRGSSCVQILSCTEDYVTVGVSGPSGWHRSIPLVNITISYDDANKRPELQERYS